MNKKKLGIIVGSMMLAISAAIIAVIMASLKKLQSTESEWLMSYIQIFIYLFIYYYELLWR